MACNISSTKNDQPNKLQRTLLNVHFNNVFKKSQEQDWQHEGTKCRHSPFTQEQEHNKAITWQIDSLKRLLAEIEKDPK